MVNKIEIKGLSKKFGQKIVLEDLDLDIEDKKSTVILGKSGTGKSVLIKNISTLLKPDSGSIKIDGIETTTMKQKEKDSLMNKFGFLFQGGALFDSLSIWENVAFKFLNNLKIDKDEAKKIALKKLDIVGLPSNIADLYPCELSGGMQKRVALARAIAADPEIIFFDEPTTGLDPVMSNVINELIIKTTKIVGATSVTITHDIYSAKKIADKIVMLDEGKIIWQGTVEDLKTTTNQSLLEFLKYQN